MLWLERPWLRHQALVIQNITNCPFFILASFSVSCQMPWPTVPSEQCISSNHHTNQLLVWDMGFYATIWTVWLQQDKDYNVIDLDNNAMDEVTMRRTSTLSRGMVTKDKDHRWMSTKIWWTSTTAWGPSSKKRIAASSTGTVTRRM